MLKLRINPIVAKDLKNIRDYIAEDNEEYAAKTIKEIYGKFENLQMFPGMGGGSFQTGQLSDRLQICDMGRLCDYLQNWKRVCRDLSCG